MEGILPLGDLNEKRSRQSSSRTRLEDVKEALKNIGVDGMTITEVRGHGRQKGHTEVYRGMEYKVDLLPKVKLEMVVADQRADEVIRTLGHRGTHGQDRRRKIFVYEVSRRGTDPQRRSRRRSIVKETDREAHIRRAMGSLHCARCIGKEKRAL